MTAPTPGWTPLPECTGCDRPVKRDAYRRNAGYCTTCRPLGPSPVQAEIDALRDWQETVARVRGEERIRDAERAARRAARRRGQ